MQKAWTLPFKNRIWQSLVIAKITNQAAVLKALDKEGASKLLAIAKGVQNGDNNNAEGYAAALYWHYLFGDSFLRGNEDNINAALNYGYAIIRGILTRALAASGFVPCFGVHHDNQLNQFNLADDIIEPFRALVDLHVFKLFIEGYLADGLLPQTKQAILKLLFANMVIDGQHTSVLTAAEGTCRSLSLATQNKDYRLLKTPKLCI